jgi:hypothetical protein
MAKKSRIFFSTYSIRLYDRGTPISFKNFNGNEDFYNKLVEFTAHILSEFASAPSIAGLTTLHLTLDKPAVVKQDDRLIYGYLSSGINDDDYKVMDEENKVLFEGKRNHRTFRKLFFYIFLPLGQQYGYVIIQRKPSLGAKGLLLESINQYLYGLGYTNFKVSLSNMLNSRVYETMMKVGNLKRIDFIKHSLPATKEELVENGPNTDKGTITTSIQARGSLSSYWKQVVDELFKREYKDSIIEIDDNIKDLNEITFELEFKGKKKTFHVLNRERTQPDVEVTDEIELDEDNIPIENSLAAVAQGLIDDLLTLDINV